MKVRTMENTEELEIDIDDIGAILKSNRLKNKKSLEEVSAELCIRKIYLTALEEGDYETLPPIPYGVGYVRTYANYLGLSAERAVKLYKASSITEERKEDEITLPPEINKSNNKHILLGVIALFLIYSLWYTYSIPSKSALETSKTTEVIKEEVEASSLTTKNIEEKEVSLLDDISEKQEETTDSNNTITNEIKEASVTTQEQVKEEQPSEDVVVVEEKTTPASLSNVEIHFIGESWIELKNKDKVYFQGVYHKGDVKSIEYISNLFISVGRPKNVEIYVKGEKKNLLAKKRKTNIPVDSLE